MENSDTDISSGGQEENSALLPQQLCELPPFLTWRIWKHWPLRLLKPRIRIEAESWWNKENYPNRQFSQYIKDCALKKKGERVPLSGRALIVFLFTFFLVSALLIIIGPLFAFLSFLADLGEVRTLEEFKALAREKLWTGVTGQMEESPQVNDRLVLLYVAFYSISILTFTLLAILALIKMSSLLERIETFLPRWLKGEDFYSRFPPNLTLQTLAASLEKLGSLSYRYLETVEEGNKTYFELRAVNPNWDVEDVLRSFLRFPGGFTIGLTLGWLSWCGMSILNENTTINGLIVLIAGIIIVFSLYAWPMYAYCRIRNAMLQSLSQAIARLSTLETLVMEGGTEVEKLAASLKEVDTKLDLLSARGALEHVRSLPPFPHADRLVQLTWITAIGSLGAILYAFLIL